MNTEAPFYREFQPVFNETDMVNLPNYDIYLKLMIDGVTSRAFSATTRPPPEKGISYKEEIVELSRKRYGRPRKEVEKEMSFKKSLETMQESKQRGLFS